MRNKDPLLRAAIRLDQVYRQRPVRHDFSLVRALKAVSARADLLSHHLNASDKARSKGWHGAEDQMMHRATGALRQLHDATTNALNHTQHIDVFPEPSLRDLYQELQQLHREFDDVNIDLRQEIISVATDAIELEGVYLGEFRIELHTSRLGRNGDATAFDVVALGPHCPSSSNDVTHPHVRDNQLCAGDATTPIANALRDGRICDAFLAVHAVLLNYNPASPYVSLDEWEGIACVDCGSVVAPDDLNYCEDCGKDYCDDCFGSCEICDRSRCRECLDQDRESGRLCCRRCWHHCDRCHRLVDANSFDSETGLCPACNEEFLEEQATEKTEEATQTKEP